MIRQVSTQFVPVAVNLYKIRQANDAGGELFRSAQQQKDQYQGIWIISPDGHVLATHQNVKNPSAWTQEVLETIGAALKAYGPVTPRHPKPTNPLPHRGLGLQKDGSVSLSVYVRSMMGGGFQILSPAIHPASLWQWDGTLKPDGPVVFDTLNLTAAEWEALSPPRAAVVGTEWTVPEAISRKFSRCLSPSSDQSTMPTAPDAKVAELKAAIESIKDGQAQIVLTGRWETKHVYDGKPSYGWASAHGVASYNLQLKNMRSFLLVFSGAFRSAPPYDKEDRPTGAVVEWRS